jgi:hypothetical protein
MFYENFMLCGLGGFVIFGFSACKRGIVEDLENILHFTIFSHFFYG